MKGKNLIMSLVKSVTYYRWNKLYTSLIAIIYEYYEIKIDFYNNEAQILNSYFICNLDNPRLWKLFLSREASVILGGDL